MDNTPIRINRKRHVLISVILLFVVIFGLENTGIDLLVQKMFFRDGAWLIDYSQPVIRFLFYDAPKRILVIGTAVILLLWLLSWVVKPLARFRERKYIYIVLCMLLVPAVVGLGKKETHVHCPYQLQEFGGDVPYVTLFEANKVDYPGRCFPAGHASGGFALLLFVMLARTRRQQLAAVATAMALGWAMGGYQMLNGRHFLSHTLTTILLAWIIILLVHMAVFGRQPIRVQSRE
ncbi:MAG TPA: phosphatase PAP2 family protein [Rhodobacteraceae bacterium]|nr:phosphatase PAP2 family protein [Paracoccaceae bacterium]